jgi:hypothetical protein
LLKTTPKSWLTSSRTEGCDAGAHEVKLLYVCEGRRKRILCRGLVSR